jgi:hypothetical protein
LFFADHVTIDTCPRALSLFVCLHLQGWCLICTVCAVEVDGWNPPILLGTSFTPDSSAPHYSLGVCAVGIQWNIASQCVVLFVGALVCAVDVWCSLLPLLLGSTCTWRSLRTAQPMLPPFFAPMEFCFLEHFEHLLRAIHGHRCRCSGSEQHTVRQRHVQARHVQRGTFSGTFSCTSF